MSVEERLRSGLTANTAHLQPNLDMEFGMVLGRAQRRRRARATGLGLAAVAAVAAVLLVSGQMGSDRATLAPAAPAPHRSAAVDGATPLETMSGALPPGTYAAEFPRSGADTRAIVEVPEGFTTDGTTLFAAPAGSAASLRAIGFWTVVEIHTDPCYGSGYQKPGPTVQDLATALARQPLRGRTADPVLTSIGGYDGLYLELAVPADLDVTDCVQGNKVERWRSDNSDRRWQETAGELDRVWILDVDGQRVVINAVHAPGASEADIDELTRIVESITFANTREQ